MGQRELAVQSIRLVQQHIGMDEGSGGVRAAALAGGGIYIDPAVFQSLLQHSPVGFAERRQRLIYRPGSLIKGNLPVPVPYKGRIDIVEMEQAVCFPRHPPGHGGDHHHQAHQLLAQPDIPVELGKIFVHRLDQVVVHRHRDVGAVQGGLQGAAVLPGVGAELQLLVLGVEECRLGVAEPAQGVVHALIGAAAKLTVIALLQRDEACMVHGVADALPIQSIREGHIRIEQG